VTFEAGFLIHLRVKRKLIQWNYVLRPIMLRPSLADTKPARAEIPLINGFRE